MPKAHPVLNLSAWEAADPKAELAKMAADVGPGGAGRGPRGPLSLWVNDGTLSPLDLYCYLKTRFGPPNGLTMAFRIPATDNMIQWHYTMKCGKHAVHALGMNARLEIHVRGRPRFTKADWPRLVTALKGDFNRRGKDISATRDSLERWTLFINPYRRLDGIVDRLVQRLNGIDTKAPVFPSPPVTRQQLERWQEQHTSWGEAIMEAKTIGCSLRMIAPVLGEAFLNLLVFALVRQDVRADERLYDDAIRKQIDVRVRSLHLHCLGFARAIDCTAQEFKAFHTLMNTRNDLLHGNVDPFKLQFDEVFFDGTIPLFKDERSLGDRLVSSSIKHIDPESARRDVQTVREFVQFILGHLHTEYRKQVELLMADDQPGWRRDRDRLGILFSECIPEFVSVSGT